MPTLEMQNHHIKQNKLAVTLLYITHWYDWSSLSLYRTCNLMEQSEVTVICNLQTELQGSSQLLQ